MPRNSVPTSGADFAAGENTFEPESRKRVAEEGASGTKENTAPA